MIVEAQNCYVSVLGLILSCAFASLKTSKPQKTHASLHIQSLLAVQAWVGLHVVLLYHSRRTLHAYCGQVLLDLYMPVFECSNVSVCALIAFIMAPTAGHFQRCLAALHACALSGMVVVNFRLELPQLMLEARYLDRKGFEVPPLALQVALQEEEYRQWQELLSGLIRQYYQVVT